MALFPKKKKAELSDIEQQNDILAAKIKELESFIAEAPEKLEREQLEKLQTMPAPDDIVQRQRENNFAHRLTKGEIRNERRHQARSALTLVLLITAIIFVSLWVYRIISSSAAI